MNTAPHFVALLFLAFPVASCAGAAPNSNEAIAREGSLSVAPSRAPEPPPESTPCPDAVPVGAQDAMHERAPADVAAIPPYAHVNPSGLASCVVRPAGPGPFPRPDDRVTVHYVGWSTEGVVFDSSLQRGRPATFPLRAVIAGWTEGVQMMTQGEVRRLWIPQSLAYQGRPGRPAGMLIFDVELIRIEAPAP